MNLLVIVLRALVQELHGFRVLGLGLGRPQILNPTSLDLNEGVRRPHLQTTACPGVKQAHAAGDGHEPQDAPTLQKSG